MTHASLPRLANLIALRSPEPARRQLFADRLQSFGEWRVSSPAKGWIVGVRDLPGSVPADPRDEADGCYFAEGQACLPASDEARASARQHLHNSANHAASSSESAEDLTFLSIRRDGQATFQRSLGGRIPCYHWQRAFGQSDDLVLATCSADLIRIAGHDGRPDPLITALCLSGHTNDVDGRAHLLGTHKLNKAQGLAIDTNGRLRCYEHWQPLAFDALKWPTQAQRKDRLERFRTTLTSTLDTGLTQSGQNLLSLSGGVDSSLLLALAVGRLAKPVTSVSVIPAVDDPVYARETERIAWLRGLYPTQPHLELPTSQPLSPFWQRLKPAAIPLFNRHMAGLTSLLDTQGPRVSFGGELADEVCGSHSFTVGDWLLHAPTHAWSFGPSDLPQSIKRVDLFNRPALLERFVRWKQPLCGQLDRWLHRDIHLQWRAARLTVDARFQRSLNSIANPFCWAFHREIDWQPMHWEWCTAQGVRRLNPFSTSRLLSLSLCSHPVERLGRADKRLSRDAFPKDFPAEVLGRRDKGVHELPQQTRLTAADWQKSIGELDQTWFALVDATYTARGLGSAVNEAEKLSNLTRFSDLPQRLVFFSASVYKVREGYL